MTRVEALRFPFSVYRFPALFYARFSVILVQNVSKTYGRFGRRTRALDGISLEVRRGETLGLIGPNGAGKTTLLCCLLGFLRPDSGAIAVEGKAPDDLS